MKPTFLLAGLLLMTTTPPNAADLPTPPDVAKKPHEVKAPFGATRNDEYYWLRDDNRKNPEMLAYLKAENAYADAVMAPLKPLQDKLYDEIVGRIKQDDSSVPYRERGYWYYTRFETGQDYPIHARRKGSMDGAEEVLLDVNAMAEGQGLLQRRRLRSQPGQQRCWPGPRTTSAAASTRSASRTSPPARSMPTRSPASRPTWSGPTTTAPCSTSRTIRKPC